MSEKLSIKQIKVLSNKAAITVALLLVLSISLFAVLPTTKAHDPAWNIPTTAYLSVIPNPIGIAQTAFVNFWIDKPTPTTNGNFGDRWHNFKVTMTKPDGTTQVMNLGSHSNADAIGGSYTTFTPTTTGNYTFVFSFPGQTLTGENPDPVLGTSQPQVVGDWCLPSTSAPVTLYVQDQPIEVVPANPIPTGYWQRPIYSTNNLWSSISGNWLGLAANTFASTGGYNASGPFNPYTTAPNTAHIIWTKPTAFGGLMGGEFGGGELSNYMSTSIAQPKFAPIIISGILYYSNYPGAATYPTGWTALDLKTGKTIWTKNTTDVLKMGQIFNIHSIQEYGGFAMLWSIPSSSTTLGAAPATYWAIWDAMTGEWICNIVNTPSMPGMTITESDDGSLICYYVNATDKTLNMWNSTRALLFPTGYSVAAHSEQTFSPPRGMNIPFSMGKMWSMPLDANYSGVVITPTMSLSKVASNVLLTRSVNSAAGSSTWSPGWEIEAGYSAIDGSKLWGPVNRTVGVWDKISLGPAGYGVFSLYDAELSTWSGFSLTTGAQLWGPVEVPHNAWSYYGMNAITAYGNIYAWDFGGCVSCVDMATGAIEWSWNTGSSGYETPYGIWPLWTFSAGSVEDGKLYIGTGHMYNPPLFHGAQLYCINATSGKQVWSVLSFDTWASPAVVDGTMITWNCYDGQIYAYGKGRTATTVSASPITIASGSATTIQGFVTDQSPGNTCLGIPAAGTPAIADQNQSAWMEYLYMQQPKPTNVNGVPVHLTAVDPNNNAQDLGFVTSDASGNYAIQWTPTITGVYKITATFDGSESYYGSSSEMAVSVTSGSSSPTQPTPTPSPTVSPTPTPTTSPTVTPSVAPTGGPGVNGLSAEYYIAIAAVVIIVAIVAVAIILRRRK